MNVSRILPALLLVATLVSAQPQPRTPARPRTATVHLAETDSDISVRILPVESSVVEFRTLHFRVNGREITITASEKLVCLDSDEYGALRLEGLKLQPAKFFFVGHYGVPNQLHTLLIFAGDAGLGANPALVIGFHRDGTPFKVLEKNALDLFGLLPQADGTALLVGRPSVPEAFGVGDGDPRRAPNAATYDPFAVYTITAEAPAAYSLGESKRYNLAHYVWAGPKISEKLAVIEDPLHLHKPILVRAEDGKIQRAIDPMRRTKR